MTTLDSKFYKSPEQNALSKDDDVNRSLAAKMLEEKYSHSNFTREKENINTNKNEFILKLITAHELSNNKWIENVSLSAIPKLNTERHDTGSDLLVKINEQEKEKNEDNKTKEFIINFAVGAKESEHAIDELKNRIEAGEVIIPEIVFGISAEEYQSICDLLAERKILNDAATQDLDKHQAKTELLYEAKMQLKNSLSLLAVDIAEAIEQETLFKNKTSGAIKEEVISLNKELKDILMNFFDPNSNQDKLELAKQIKDLLKQYEKYISTITAEDKKVKIRNKFSHNIDLIEKYTGVLRIVDNTINNLGEHTFNPLLSKSTRTLTRLFDRNINFLRR